MWAFSLKEDDQEDKMGVFKICSIASVIKEFFYVRNFPTFFDISNHIFESWFSILINVNFASFGQYFFSLLIFYLFSVIVMCLLLLLLRYIEFIYVLHISPSYRWPALIYFLAIYFLQALFLHFDS